MTATTAMDEKVMAVAIAMVTGRMALPPPPARMSMKTMAGI
jgi:hypothetical protein